MKIAVIGAGIIGVTSAYELAADGHAVTVFERRSAVAEETSFANAGVVAPGYVTPWAAPGMPGKVLSYLFSRHAPVRLTLPLNLAELGWMWRWWRACRLSTYQANRLRLQRLAFYSRERLHTLSSSLQLDYERADGYMVLLRGEQEAQLVQPGLQVLQEAGVQYKTLDAAAARKIEPALNPDMPLHGAIHLPDDEVANCRQFALLLRNAAQQIGVDFRFQTVVQALDRAQPTRLQLRRTPQDGAATTAETFDAVLVCGGLHSAALLRPLGLRLPLAAVYGYSVTAQLREPLHAPRAALMDERYKVAISRLGQRVRVAGSAEIGGRLDQQREAAVATLFKVLQDWFPGGAQLQTQVQRWKGARPMLPDGPPVLGASGIPGVWLNLGHGSSGWALSCGSARAVADLIQGRTPALDLEGLDVSRLRG